MIRYYITDRRALGGEMALLRNLERLGDSIDFVQVREKDLEARELSQLVREVVRVAHPAVRVLVNDRADVAIACGAHGVHLRSNAISPVFLRPKFPSDFLISVACHSFEDVRRAEREGADLALLAPIFDVANKGPALGLEVLREAAGRAQIPVLALGGVDESRIIECMAAGAAGFAAIRCFQDPPSSDRGEPVR